MNTTLPVLLCRHTNHQQPARPSCLGPCARHRLGLRTELLSTRLVGLGLLLAASLAVAFATTALAGRLVHAAGTGTTPARWLLAMVGLMLGAGVNTLLSIAVLTGLPRLRMPLRRVLGPALLVAAGLEVLKTLGRLYVQRTEANPTYQVVAGAVGLLVFLNVVNQLILFAAALAATGTAGQVTDLAARPARDVPPPRPG
jgi:membrane protein